jgi:hypothetical protein
MTVVLYWAVRMPKKWGVGALVGMVRVKGKEWLERARGGSPKKKVDGGEGTLSLWLVLIYLPIILQAAMGTGKMGLYF